MLTSYDHKVEENNLRPAWHFGLTLYCVFGLIGTVWISDDFDSVRGVLTVAIGIPALTAFHMMHRYVRNWYKRWPVFHKLVLAAILIPFTWGQVLLLNALGEQPKRMNYSSMKQAVPVVAAKGPLGIVYRKRW